MFFTHNTFNCLLRNQNTVCISTYVQTSGLSIFCYLLYFVLYCICYSLQGQRSCLMTSAWRLSRRCLLFSGDRPWFGTTFTLMITTHRDSFWDPLRTGQQNWSLNSEESSQTPTVNLSPISLRFTRWPPGASPTLDRKMFLWVMKWWICLHIYIMTSAAVHWYLMYWSTDGEDQSSDYNPHEALQLALTDWLLEFGRADSPDGKNWTLVWFLSLWPPLNLSVCLLQALDPAVLALNERRLTKSPCRRTGTFPGPKTTHCTRLNLWRWMISPCCPSSSICRMNTARLPSSCWKNFTGSAATATLLRPVPSHLNVIRSERDDLN